MRPIESSAELYAHAIALEREAAERYAQFAQRMKDEGRDDLAALFGTLARQEGEHLETLERRTEGVALPELRGSQYKWLDSGPPESGARELVFRLMTPRQALAIALYAEQRAQAFFEHAYWSAGSGGARAGEGDGRRGERARRAGGARAGGDAGAGAAFHPDIRKVRQACTSTS